MIQADLLARLARRAEEAERIGAVAPVAAVLRDVATEMAQVDGTPVSDAGAAAVDQRSWFWTCPPETRIVGVPALAAATGLTTAWIYRRTARMPHVRLDGLLLFEIGAVRLWILEQAVEVRPAVVVVQRRRRGTA